MSWTNFHSHSHFCDGVMPPEAHVQAAIEEGLSAFGFSSHAPVPFDNSWCMKAERLEDYLQLTQQLKAQYADQIPLSIGMEVDYVPGQVGPGSYPQLDYRVGSIHYVDHFEDGHPWEVDGAHRVFLTGLMEIFGGDIQKAVCRYFELTREMLETDPPEILGHLDKIKIQYEDGQLFSETAPWYKKAVFQTLEVIKSSGVIVEINTRGIYKKKHSHSYPGPWIIEQLRDMKIPLMLNSDSHHPREISLHFEEIATFLQQKGIHALYSFHENEWQPFAFTPNGLIIPTI